MKISKLPPKNRSKNHGNDEESASWEMENQPKVKVWNSNFVFPKYPKTPQNCLFWGKTCTPETYRVWHWRVQWSLGLEDKLGLKTVDWSIPSLFRKKPMLFDLKKVWGKKSQFKNRPQGFQEMRAFHAQVLSDPLRCHGYRTDVKDKNCSIADGCNELGQHTAMLCRPPKTSSTCDG